MTIDLIAFCLFVGAATVTLVVALVWRVSSLEIRARAAEAALAALKRKEGQG